jgi:UDP-N-acetylmuramoyl-L-alanyl-D-glutamate--2,6-diaminopimelate ligase
MPGPGSALGDLATGVGGTVHGDPAVEVVDVTHDSRQAGPGVLYVAVRGASHDGHAFLGAVRGAGSPAAVVDHITDDPITQLVVDDTRDAMGHLAATVHGDPSRALAVVGVTGTNGKTTVTHFVESIAARAGRVPGLIGTVHTRVGDTPLVSERTTPEATDFQRLLAEMRDLGADLVAAEISSHALELGRVAATRFAVAAFTNLSQDHLDFHGDMEAYRRAKERLFREYEVGTSVLNVGDPVGAEIGTWVQGPKILVGPGGDLWVEEAATSFEGTVFDLVTDESRSRVRSPLIGAFNVENALVAAGCCLAIGLTLDEVVAGLQTLEPVTGRFEPISGDAPIKVVVDYAHTPEGISQAVAVAKGLARGRVIALFGAGGDRDREKRPLMGAAASTADLAVATSDNPRSEDPDQIIAEVVAGLRSGVPTIVEPDRRKAIAIALDEAQPGDVVLILGKGHETGQEVKGVIHPFDDHDVAREALAQRLGATGYPPDSGSMSQ